MLEQYAKAFEALPAALRTPARKAALDKLMEAGLPGSDLEDWKYTDAAAPFSAVVVPAPTGAMASLADVSSEALADGFDALNAAFAEQGSNFTVKAGEPAVIEAGLGRASVFGSRFLHRRNRIQVQAGASATILVHSPAAQIGETEDAYATLFTELELADNSSVTLVRVQNEAPNRLLVERLNAKLGRDARLNMISVDLGGKLVRSDINISLDAPGAEVQLHGLYAPIGQTHVDNHTTIEHRAPHCTSREFYRGVIGETARAVFNGKIVVREGARKTDSEQRVANLLLSPKAEVNAKPELEIYNDDVKCAHGATFGQLDEDAVFYLRSRGLPENVARSLLTWTFAYEIIEKIAQDEIRKMVQDAFIARLPNGELLKDLL